MANKSNRLMRNSGLLVLGLLMLGLTGCFGRNSQQLMAGSIKNYMKSNPATVQLNYTLPGAIGLFSRGEVYTASNHELSNEVAVLPETALSKNKKKLAGLVGIGWLHKKKVTAWPEEHNYTKAWLMTINSDPQLLSLAESSIKVIKNKLQPLDAALEVYPLKFFWHGKITKRHTLELPTKLAANFFVLPRSGDSEKTINVFHALASHGYLAKQKMKVWIQWTYGDYIKTITSDINMDISRATRGWFYFITPKGKPWLKRNPDYLSNNSEPIITLATADIYKPLVVRKKGNDVILYVTGKIIPSPLWDLKEVRDWAKSSPSININGVKNIGKSVILKLNLKKFTGDYQFSSFPSGKPQTLLVYQLTKTGKTFLGGGNKTITYGKWKFVKITNYTESKHNTLGGRIVDILLKFEPTLPAQTMKTVAAVADSAKQIIHPSTTKAGQCLLVKMHQGWKVSGCHMGS